MHARRLLDERSRPIRRACGGRVLFTSAAGMIGTLAEALTMTRLHSGEGLRVPGLGLMWRQSLRSPQYSLARAGLVGGGTPPRPGELSLAHHGVLFLDEFAEYRAACSTPCASGSRPAPCTWRAGSHAHFPAGPLLVAAMNPWGCSSHARPAPWPRQSDSPAVHTVGTPVNTISDCRNTN